ncbi:MAG: hypothetical protein HQK92_02260 [Nitrospirae bacterium]|nr:hypothetical protein [Nitrospirota bacterium]
MSAKTFTIVTTTINIPYLLEDYIKDAIRFNRNLSQIIVVGDKKTPDETGVFCERLKRQYGVDCLYVSPAMQESVLSRCEAFRDFLPWNCIQRRNVGLVLAYEGSSDIVVTIDDDNFLCQSDYLGHHGHVGQHITVEAVSSQTGWWNVCEMLEEEHNIRFYHRGHPLSKRWLSDEVFQATNTITGRIVVNAGLWLDDPDVDALTRLFVPVRVTKTSACYKDTIACDKGTWAPFNSQNTAIMREAIPAYLLFPHVGRYDDIWASYVLRHIAEHLGDIITYGGPLVRQKRNPHNYFKDFDAERFGLEYNDVFLETLCCCKLSANTYKGAYSEIAAQFPEKIVVVCDNKKIDFNSFNELSKGLKLWTEVFKS